MKKLLAWFLAALGPLFLAGAILLSPGSTFSAYMISFAVVALLGGLIAARQPGSPYGWIWLGMGDAFSLQGFTQAYAERGLVIAPGTLPLAEYALILAGIGWSSGLGLNSFVLLLFPNGRLPTRRWRPVAWILNGAILSVVTLGWAVPGPSGFVTGVENPFGLPGLPGQIVEVITLGSISVLFGGIPISFLSLLIRYRRATGVERQQLKWVAFGATLFVAILISDFIITLPGVWEPVKEGLGFSLLPVTVSVAILRHRLYDIDVIIRRTLVYSVLTGLLALTFFGSVTLMDSLLTAVTGPRSQIATVISTLAIAALFTPLRRRVQGAVDRRFYRRRYDAERALANFATAARDETDLEHLSDRLLAVVKETVRPAHMSLWIRRMYYKPSQK